MTRKPSPTASKKRESEQRKERELFSWHSPFPLGGESERTFFAFFTLISRKHTNFAAGRRHRHHEHHAGQRAQTDEGDRSAEGHRSAARRHQNTTLDRGDHNQRARRIARHTLGLRDCEAGGLLRLRL